MKRSTKIFGSTSALIAAAAFSGLITGAATRAVASSSHSIKAAAKVTVDSKAGVKARFLDDQAGKHDCKGKNDCKGQGGCNGGDNGCKGKNSCKGKGGCKTNAL